MAIKRLDHVVVIVEDLAAAVSFFTELGLKKDMEANVAGDWVDRVNGIQGVNVDLVMMVTPDGHGKLEISQFRNPELVKVDPQVQPPNALGLRSVMFAVDSVDETVAHMQKHGGELIGEVAQYQNLYRLCYMRGPGGIIVALAEELF